MKDEGSIDITDNICYYGLDCRFGVGNSNSCGITEYPKTTGGSGLKQHEIGMLSAIEFSLKISCLLLVAASAL